MSNQTSDPFGLAPIKAEGEMYSLGWTDPTVIYGPGNVVLHPSRNFNIPDEACYEFKADDAEKISGIDESEGEPLATVYANTTRPSIYDMDMYLGLKKPSFFTRVKQSIMGFFGG